MKIRRRLLALLLLALWAGTAWWHAHKSLPPGMHSASAVCSVNATEVTFIPDITAADAWGRAVVSQGIFDATLAVARQARRFIVLDYALFGTSAAGASQRRLAVELSDALLTQRRALPDLKVLFITDPVNEGYGASASPELELLRQGGVDVVPADLDRLRDSNLWYSSLWRLTLRWWDTPAGPFGIATRRLNGKSDHRKLIVADDGGGGLAAVIASANPADAESTWSNVGARVQGAALNTLLASELAVARFSGWHGPAAAYAPAAWDCAPSGGAAVQVLTEGALRAALLQRLSHSSRGDSIDMALLYLSEHEVSEALLAAARRGVGVRLILDPDANAGSAGAGMPNQPLASALVARSGGAIHVRWYRTHGERFHDTLVMIYGRERLWLTLGSANLTRRGLDDYNLEANVAVETLRSSAAAQQALGYFDTLWMNRAALGIEYTADFAVYSNPAQLDYWLARLLEGTGLSSF